MSRTDVDDGPPLPAGGVIHVSWGDETDPYEQSLASDYRRNRPLASDYLRAAKMSLQSPPSGQYGLWHLSRHKAGTLSDVLRLGHSWQTCLRRLSVKTMYQELGEVVMEDSREELRRHLPIWMKGHGRILISGLGLGCVVRGLLINPRVKHIDVIEIDRTIIDLFGPEFFDEPRVRIWHGDALTIPWPEETAWDFAWHDCWTDEGAEGEPPLTVLHSRLFMRYEASCRRQGAWAWPREFRRHGINPSWLLVG